MKRLRRARNTGDQGSALAIALTFLMIFGLLIGVVLQFATTGQRTTLSVRDEATSTYAGGGALDGAINGMRSVLTSGLASGGSTTCFTLPSGELGNTSAVTVTCSPRTGSGGTASSPSQPNWAVTAVSPTSTEGVNVQSGTTTLQGGAAVNQALTVATGATLDSSGYAVQARSCPAAGTGTVKDSCATFAGVADPPGYPGPSTIFTPQQTALPACAATVTLPPGIYRSAAALQTVLNCSGATIVLSSGTYFFDFQDAGTHELIFAGGPRNSTIVGGARSGSSCVPTSPGVDLVFGADSRLTVQSGKVDLCALVPSADTTNQHIVLRGLTTATSVSTSTPRADGVTGTSIGTTAWSSPGKGALIDGGATTTTSLPNSGSQNAILKVTLPAAVAPADATKVSATLYVKESVNTTNTTTTSVATVKTSGGATIDTGTLLACSTSTTCAGVLKEDPTSAFAATAAQLNGGFVEVKLSKTSNGAASGAIDGLYLVVTYELPIRQVCTLNAGACVAGSVPANPMLLASGAYSTTPLALHGTIYAPTSSVDLRLTSVTATVVDRGMVVRHLLLSMTPAVSAPALISIPDLPRQPRQVLLVARDGSGAQLARADVTFSDGSGGNGTIPKVNEWSVN